MGGGVAPPTHRVTKVRSPGYQYYFNRTAGVFYMELDLDAAELGMARA
jgi:hypothetical protein